MDESVVERGVDVCDAEHELALSDLGAERHLCLFLGRLRLLGGLHPHVSEAIHHSRVISESRFR